jgi:hypothetical protein
VVVVVIVVFVAVGVAAVVLPDTEHDQEAARDVVHPADVTEFEVSFRPEEHRDHGDGADQVAHPEDETRREAVEPLVRAVQRVGGGHGPAVARLDAVDQPESDRARHESRDAVECHTPA